MPITGIGEGCAAAASGAMNGAAPSREMKSRRLTLCSIPSLGFHPRGFGDRAPLLGLARDERREVRGRARRGLGAETRQAVAHYRRLQPVVDRRVELADD